MMPKTSRTPHSANPAEMTASRRQLLGGSALALAAAALPLTNAPAAAQEPPKAEPKPEVTTALSRFIAAGSDMPIAEDIRELARLHILDTLASAVACRDLEAARLGRAFADAQSGDARKNTATILATRKTAALVDAVFASAMTAHAAEINDFVPSAFVQPGPSIVSAAIALSEQRNRSGAEFLRAVAVGYEMCSRFPKALGDRNLRASGLANHGVGPTFGVAAAASVLLKLPEDRISDVLTFCSQQASGSWQWLLDVEHVEKAFVFAGMGARTGLQAALFAEMGFRGVRNNLDQPGGFMNQGMFTGPGSDQDRAYLIEDLGSRWELPLTGFKRYPSGGPTQPAVQGVLNLLPEIKAADVASVRIEMPGRWQAFRDAAMPALNLRYLSSIILIDRKLDFVSAQSLDRMNTDSAVKAFMAKVDVVHDAAQEAPAGQPRVESARVIITGRDGRRHESFVPYVLGYPSHPMKRPDVEAKALELMVPVLGKSRAGKVIETSRTIDRMPKAGALAALIAT
jgi:2-methylcitrate dehydratase PrpD